MITKLDFVGIPSQDPECSRTFYVETLGLRPDEHSRFEVWAGDTCFGIWQPENGACLRAAEECSSGVSHGALHRFQRQRPHAAPPLRAEMTALARA